MRALIIFALFLCSFAYIEGLNLRYYENTGDRLTLWLGPLYSNFATSEGDITMYGTYYGSEYSKYNRATFSVVEIQSVRYIKVVRYSPEWHNAPLCEDGSLYYSSASLQFYLETIPGTRLTNAMPFTSEHCGTSLPPGEESEPETSEGIGLPFVLFVGFCVIVIIAMIQSCNKKSSKAKTPDPKLETVVVPSQNPQVFDPQNPPQVSQVIYLQPGAPIPAGLVPIGQLPPQPASGQTIQPMSVNGVPTGQAVHNQYVPHPAQPMTAPVQVPSEISTHSYVQPMIIQAEPTGASPQQMNVLQQSVVQPMVPSFEGDSGML